MRREQLGWKQLGLRMHRRLQLRLQRRVRLRMRLWEQLRMQLLLQLQRLLLLIASRGGTLCVPPLPVRNAAQTWITGRKGVCGKPRKGFPRH